MTISKAGRSVLPQFLSAQECKELEFIHKSCGVVGYRPFVLSTTMSHLVATNCAHLIIPILSVRERVKEVVEEQFGREYELFVEFTGLISWTKGANIGWHSDNNRLYLQQRHYSAVCYLNNYDKDFKGGLFHFQDGEPLTIYPSTGMVVIYSADEQNMHCVDEVTSGERCTLALWFTLDQAHDEDQKLIQQLSTTVPGFLSWLSDPDCGKGLCKLPPKQEPYHPIAASSVMYNIQTFKNPSGQLMEGNSSEQPMNSYLKYTSDDLRVVRMASMGLRCYFTSTTVEDQHDNPILLTYKSKQLPYLFSNSLGALQIVQFHQHQRDMMVKRPSPEFGRQVLENPDSKICTFYPDSSHSQTMSAVEEAGFCITQTRANISCHALSIDDLQEVITDHAGDMEKDFVSGIVCKEMDGFIQSIQQYNIYTSNLWGRLFELFPLWRANGSILIHI